MKILLSWNVAYSISFFFRKKCLYTLFDVTASNSVRWCLSSTTAISHWGPWHNAQTRRVGPVSLHTCCWVLCTNTHQLWAHTATLSWPEWYPLSAVFKLGLVQNPKPSALNHPVQHYGCSHLQFPWKQACLPGESPQQKTSHYQLPDECLETPPAAVLLPLPHSERSTNISHDHHPQITVQEQKKRVENLLQS